MYVNNGAHVIKKPIWKIVLANIASKRKKGGHHYEKVYSTDK